MPKDDITFRQKRRSKKPRKKGKVSPTALPLIPERSPSDLPKEILRKVTSKMATDIVIEAGAIDGIGPYEIPPASNEASQATIDPARGVTPSPNHMEISADREHASHDESDQGSVSTRVSFRSSIVSDTHSPRPSHDIVMGRPYDFYLRYIRLRGTDRISKEQFLENYHEGMSDEQVNYIRHDATPSQQMLSLMAVIHSPTFRGLPSSSILITGYDKETGLQRV
jgi:hypothetical protein